VPLPQARRESLTTSRPAYDKTANDADESAYEDLAPEDEAALSEPAAEPASAEIPELVESATLYDEDDASLPDGAVDQADMAGDAAETGDAVEPEGEADEIPPVDEVP